MMSAFFTDLSSRLERGSTLADDDLEARRRKVTLVVSGVSACEKEVNLTTLIPSISFNNLISNSEL